MTARTGQTDRQLAYLVWATGDGFAAVMDEAKRWGTAGNYALRYQLAFAGYALAAAARARPEARAMLVDALGRVVDRLIERPVWEYWASRGRGLDPVAQENIMYSGHLAHLIGLYEAAGGDGRYDAGFELIWDDRTRFPYTHASLVERIHAQMAANPHHNVPCEPGLIYFSCNTHAAWANLLHDRAHGTSLARINDDWLDWSRRHLIVPPGSIWPRGVVRAAHSERHRLTVPLSLALIDAWSLLFLAGLDPGTARAGYPRLRRQLKPGRDGGLRLRAAPLSDRLEVSNECLNTALAYGAARALGDDDAAGRLRRHLDAAGGPVERDGRRWYAGARPAVLVTALVTLGDCLDQVAPPGAAS